VDNHGPGPPRRHRNFSARLTLTRLVTSPHSLVLVVQLSNAATIWLQEWRASVLLRINYFNSLPAVGYPFKMRLDHKQFAPPSKEWSPLNSSPLQGLLGRLLSQELLCW
jgi:hypothetical protein